jgi:hypothetical protein
MAKASDQLFLVKSLTSDQLFCVSENRFDCHVPVGTDGFVRKHKESRVAWTGWEGQG